MFIHMKKLLLTLLLTFSTTLFTSSLKAQTADPLVPATDTEIIPSEDALGAHWKTITEAENHQTILLPSDQKLFVYLSTDRLHVADDVITYTLIGDSILQADKQGDLTTKSATDANHHFYLSSPTGRGTATLTFFHHGLWKTTIMAKFTIQIKE